jgi:hypothetical protein
MTFTAVLCFKLHQNFVFDSDRSRFTQNNEFLRDVMLCCSVIPDLDPEDEGSVFGRIVLDILKDCAAFAFWVIDHWKIFSQRCSLSSHKTFNIQQ